LSTEVEKLKDHYDLEFKVKENLENKASSMLTVAGIVAPLLFGFGQLFVEKLAGIPDRTSQLHYFIFTLLVGCLACLASIVFSVIATRVQEYVYVIGATTIPRPSLASTLKNMQINTGEEQGQISAYKESIEKNAGNNDLKKSWLEASQWAFVVGITMIAIILSWLLIFPVKFPS
jgi:hypothetical protein